jgi:hypothetical protein
MPTLLALRSFSGNFVSSNLSDSRRITAVALGIGGAEVFQVVNITTGDDQLRHDDTVALRDYHGRYLTAEGGGGSFLGTVRENQRSLQSQFLVQRAAGPGDVAVEDSISLRTSDGQHFLQARNGGGHEINSLSTWAREWETFRAYPVSTRAIRLRSHDDRFLTDQAALNLPLRFVSAEPGPTNVFIMMSIGLTGTEPRVGQVVGLRTNSGRIVSFVSTFSSERWLDPEETQIKFFNVGPEPQEPGVPPPLARLRHGSLIQIVSAEGLRLWRVGLDGSIILAPALRRRPGRDEFPRETANFTLEWDSSPVHDCDWIPNGSDLPGRPLETPPAVTSGTAPLVVFHYRTDLNGGSLPPLNVPDPQGFLSHEIFEQNPSSPPTLNSWLKDNSNGVFQAQNLGIFGPIPISEDRPLPVTQQVNDTARLTAAPAASLSILARSIRRNPNSGLVEVAVHGGIVGNNRPLSVRIRNTRIECRASYVGVAQPRNAALSADERMVLCHEVSHGALGVFDRYNAPVKLHGDFTATSRDNHDWQRLHLAKAAGSGEILSGDSVFLGRGEQWAVIDPQIENALFLSGSQRTTFRVERIANGGIGPIEIGDQIGLSWADNRGQRRWVAAYMGGGGGLYGNSNHRSSWETFAVMQSDDGRPSGRLSSGATFRLQSIEGFDVMAFRSSPTNGVGTPWANLTPEQQASGFRFVDNSDTNGAGFDNSSSNYSTILLGAYDRCIRGWVNPSYLTPDDGGTYCIAPFLQSRQVVILYDPLNPIEWYTVENRQRVPFQDEVPSSGLVISWCCTDEAYWRSWFERWHLDPGRHELRRRFPAVISSLAADKPPNALAGPMVIDHGWYYKRNYPDSAFTHGMHTLPLGDGRPSNFVIEVSPERDSVYSLKIRRR